MRQNFNSGRPWASYRAHGDPFPLPPDWIASGAEERGVAFPRRGAWTAKALNTLALHDPNSDFDSIFQAVPPTETQKQVSARILDCFQEAETPPEGMDGPSCLASLLDGKCLYNKEPKNLASFDYNKLKVLHSPLKPRRLEEVLPQHAKSILQKYQTFIEKSTDEISKQEPCGVIPYWDAKLRKSDSELVRLITALANQGLVTFRTAIKERIGFFFVKKKSPEWIRMVIDSRRVNAQHTCPPTTRLSTPRSYLDIQFPPAEGNTPLGFGIEADVNDCFYNYFTEELASWFGIDRPGSIQFWGKRAGNQQRCLMTTRASSSNPSQTVLYTPYSEVFVWVGPALCTLRMRV